MAERIVDIVLTQLVLWYDATRIQTWPALLTAIPPEVELPSPTDFGRTFFTARMTDRRHAVAEKITRNFPGLEEKNGRLFLRGVGLLERTENHYRLSEAALILRNAYLADRSGREWIVQLATLLLTREPRTRVLVKLLSRPGAVLRFARNGWFAGGLRRARIELPGERVLAPFALENSGVPCLREPLQENAWWALGSWRNHPSLRDATGCRFVGHLKGPYSMHDVGLALHAACEVLLVLGILRSKGIECWLDAAVARDVFGTPIAKEFGWPMQLDSRQSLPELLAQLINELQSDTGFVVASELRDALKRRGFDNPDREIAELESLGVVRIDAEDYGQSRHGVGLHGDPRRQLIKIHVIGGLRP